MPKTTVTGLRLAPEVLAWLKTKGAAEQRSLAFIVNGVVRAEMAREARSAKQKPKRKAP
jgi:hypothetical protein